MIEYLSQFLVALLASGGAFMFGILLGWSAPAASQIIERHEDDFYFWITNSQFTWIVAMMPLGAVFSCVLSGIIRNIIGTRFTFLLFGIPILIGLTLLTIPLNPGMLIAGRFLCGISIGCYSYIVPIYVGEIASNKIRGRLLSLFQVCLNFGILFIYILGHFTTYRVFNIVCGILSIFYSFGCLVLPESPPFLIRKQRELDADYSLKILRGKSFNTYEEIQMLKRQHQEFLNQKKTITEIFKTKTTLKAFFIIMLQFTFLQMTGINAVLFFSTIIFNEAKINLEPGIASIIVASVLVCATFLSVTFVDRFGRKFLLISSNILMFFGLCGIGTYFTLKDEGNNIDALTWLPVTSLSIFTIGFSSGMGPITYILLGELFLQEAKIFIAPIGQLWSFLLIFIIGLTFPTMTSAMGAGATFFMFSAFCGVSLLFTIFYIPETKGKSTEDIHRLLENNSCFL